MAVKNGNDYMVWVAAPATTPSFALMAGQQNLTFETSQQTADASSKTSGTVAIKLPTLREITIGVDFVADLPDAAGYTVVETAHKTQSRVLVQVRKDGATGSAPDDVIFQAEMWATNLSVNPGLNAALAGSVQFVLAATPTTDLTLA
ncbi:MAG: hypothetical protein MUE77_12210 [Sandarakinorhabdus sp.]|jgi:predicted secreted protein|nr:hypothetical protein [Sandarakinorhabdus sp.]